MFKKIKDILFQPIIISSAVVTAVLFGIQNLGLLEQQEIQVFDQMTRWNASSKPDPRLLIVGFTEKDIQKYQYPPSDELFLQVFQKLEQHQPRAIGFDFIRDRANTNDEQGHGKLLEHLQNSSIIFPICNHADGEASPSQQDGNTEEIAPPKGVEPEQVGFSNLVQDRDGAIRRNLLLVDVAPKSLCTTSYSLGLQLALKYLEPGNVTAKLTAENELQIGKVVFKRLQSHVGGYQQIDAGGYQILMNYTSEQIAPMVGIADVLENRVAPDLIKDRVILMGATAPSLKDLVKTPLNVTGEIPGVEVHAYSVSQILSAVMDNKPLFWFLPEWGEVIWLWGWSVVGGLLVLRLRHPIVLALGSTISGAVLWGGSFFLFTQAGWFPVISPFLGLVLTGGSVLAYSAYQSQQEQEKILEQVQEQQDAIAQLQLLLKQTQSTSEKTEVVTPLGMEMSPGTMLRDRYKIVSKLAAGGFGGTYLAEDTQRPGNPVHVVKQLRPARQDTQFLQVARRLFKQEAEILELVGKYDRIPQLMACFEENQQFFIVQEYIKGTPLNKEIHNRKKLPASQVIPILKDVLEILVFIHSYHIIHRDIKPSNLIRREQDKRIVLIDFGAVKKIQPQQPETQTVAIATIGYAPSEQISGLPKLNSDIHALGITAIELLTGIEPKRYQRNVDTGEIEILVSNDIPPQSWRIVAQIFPELAEIINKMVHFDFNSRYQSATEVLKDLKTVKISGLNRK